MFPVNKQTMYSRRCLSTLWCLLATISFKRYPFFSTRLSFRLTPAAACLSPTVICCMFGLFLIYDLNAYSSPTFALCPGHYFDMLVSVCFHFGHILSTVCFATFGHVRPFISFICTWLSAIFTQSSLFFIENSLCKPKVLTSISGCFGKYFLQFLFLKHWKEENCQFCLLPCLVYVNILIVIFFSSFYPFILGKIWRALLVFDLRLHALSGWYFYPS